MRTSAIVADLSAPGGVATMTPAVEGAGIRTRCPRAETYVSAEADRLQQLAEETAAAARSRIRQTFQDRWGSYLKCGRCGGCITVDDQRCPHGDHLAEPMRNGYASPPCSRCRGTGADPNPSPQALDIAMLTDSIQVPCDECHGRGTTWVPWYEEK